MRPLTTLTRTERHSATTDVDVLAVDTLRFLACDMVEAAGSGHPGMPLGAAPLAWALFSRHLRHDPAAPDWADRDRFVLSAGHGSALLYALLHVTGYDLPTEELGDFRQLGSRTPGHPEVGHTVGVETTTGPLGQGLATAVGLALAEQMQASRYPELTDHRTWAVVGDGCLMEGVSHEAASLAGHLRLGRLVVLWDDNRITIDGAVDETCSDDQQARFAAYGWHVVTVADGTDVDEIDTALTQARHDPRPSLVAVRTVIGHGAPDVAGTSRAHGTPLGTERLAAMKRAAGWSHPALTVPAPVAEHARALAADGALAHETWRERARGLARTDPARSAQWHRTQRGDLPADWDASIRSLVDRLRPDDGPGRATRQWSQVVLRSLVETLPELVGGSADLAGSTGTDTGQRLVTRDDFSGSRISFGIREHAMAAVLNGLALHGGFRPYGSTFLVFSDYLRPALRLSALMGQPVVYVLTHDSVAVGEDGPTHQPVEHVESLRLVPGVQVLRPADEVETLAAWQRALETTDRPTVLILSRQSLPSYAVPAEPGSGVRVVRPARAPAVEIVATGSEVTLAAQAADLLALAGITVRVVSAWDRAAYVPDPEALVTVSVEAGATSGWRGIVDLAIGVDEFGASGPASAVLERLGLTPEAVAERIRAHLHLTGTHPKEH